VSAYRFFWRRGNERPLVSQPLVVRSVAHAVFPRDWQEDRSRQRFVKLQWVAGGSAEVRQAGRCHRVVAGDVVLWAADSEHWARSGPDGWNCWWFTLSPSCPAWPTLDAFGLGRAGVWSAGACPQALFRELAAAVSEMSPDGEERAGAIAYRIVAHAARARGADDERSLADRAMADLLQHWADPLLGVAAVADRIGTHRSRLCRAFARAYGMPPSRWLLRLRLSRATALLRGSTRDIAEIAAACGFADPSYFARAFRRAYGEAPGEYRSDPGM
jgi:AraC-like DNA-binding protein